MLYLPMNSKYTVLSATAFVFLGGVLGYLVHQHDRLRQTLEATEDRCVRQIADVEAALKRDLYGLQRQLLAQHDSQAGLTGGTAAASESSAPVQDDGSLLDAVNAKYRFLFSNLNMSQSDRHTLILLLVAREQIVQRIREAREREDIARVTNIAQLQLEMSAIDDQIKPLLDAKNLERYELLKDSSAEQRHFREYVAQEDSIPFTPVQEEAVLFAKLRHKQTYEKAIENTTVFNDYPLNGKQRTELYKSVEKALNKYRNDFLMDVFPVLDGGEEQFMALAKYENEKFARELEKYKELIDKRVYP